MRRTLPLLLLLSLLAGCASRGAATAGDPLERLNREVFDVNVILDDNVIRPIAVGYRRAVPSYARTRIRLVLSNLQEPRILINNLLQFRLLDAGHTTMRFFLNSTVGLGGLFDIATPAGIAQRSGDFGQTLHVWGLAPGPYLMLPVAGPSNPRDLVGLVTDGFLNPIAWLLPLEATIVRSAAEGVDLREQNIENVDELRRGSLDFYARLRSVWQQRRDAELGMQTDTVPVLEDPDAPR